MSAVLMFGTFAVDPGYVELIENNEQGGCGLQIRGEMRWFDVPFKVMLRAYSEAKDDLSTGYLSTYTVEQNEDQKWVVKHDKVMKDD